MPTFTLDRVSLLRLRRSTTFRTLPAPLKDPAVIGRQLEPAAARLLFKCASRLCDFASDEPEAFVAHACAENDDDVDSDASDSVEMIRSNRLVCVYCCSRLDNIEHLAGHMIQVLVG